MPGVDWYLLKAQCYQESRLNPAAVSPVGAQGICQFMPRTWSDVAIKLDLPPGASAFAPQLAINAAAFYMSRIRAQWSAPRPEPDRHSLALASYNAGIGHILSAQALCGDPSSYSAIIVCLPSVTGKHAKETTGYVELTWSWYRQMKLWGQ